MGTRKRGTVTPTPDELTIERNKRARAASEIEKEPLGTANPPPDPAPPAPPDLPPVPVRQWPETIGDYALNLLRAQSYARLARDAGMLDVNTSDAQAVLLIMRGFEMGITPIRALTELYLSPTEQGGLEIVEEATLIRARIARSGLGVIEPVPALCSEKVGTVQAIRHDRFGHRHAQFSYSLDNATTDGLMLKRNWQSGANREALLIARATTKAARAWFSDIEGARYTAEELGGGEVPGDGLQAPAHTASPPPTPPTPTAPVAAPTPGAGRRASNGAATGATDAGGPHPPVAPPPGPGVAAAPPPSAPPPSRDGPAPTATRQEKMAYYADTSKQMQRPWTSNIGMSRDAQPVPLVSHGATTDQITTILNYTVKGRMPEWTRADEALGLVIDHLGTLSIDTSILPAPYCFFALTQQEAEQILQGLVAFSRADAEGDPPADAIAEPPTNPHDEVQEGQTHSWTQANDHFEAVLRRLAYHATRGDVLAMMHQTTGKEFNEMTADELYGAAADIDRLGKQPTILKQAIDRMRIARGA